VQPGPPGRRCTDSGAEAPLIEPAIPIIGGMETPSTDHPLQSSAALTRAQQAWALLHIDAGRAVALADAALAEAEQTKDQAAEAWARLTRGHHLTYFARPRQAAPELRAALALFEVSDDRAGQVLAHAGLARGLWREGQTDKALALVLSWRDEGLAVLRHDQRGLLLNAIAGCYSALNQSEQAFAYMYEALRDASPTEGHGYDAVLHCNLAHELLQLGDYHEALKHVNAGLARLEGTSNARLLCGLLINRVICLTDLNRATEALPDIDRVCAIPADASGRGALTPYFETMAIAAFRADRPALGRDLVARARLVEREGIAEEEVEVVVAEAMLMLCEGQSDAAALALQAARERCYDDSMPISLRTRHLVVAAWADALEAVGDTKAAVAALRECQHITARRSQLAARAHQQATTLQVEVLLLQHELVAKDAQRQAIERARDELVASNRALSQKIQEVEALQSALRQQAMRDELTGLHNRRFLNETLPGLWAMAERNQSPLAVAIIDLDHFKMVNDQLGHDAGDRLLAAFGRLLLSELRKSDIACRWGGEEFCVLMPGTSSAAALRAVSHLLKLWQVQALILGTLNGAGTSFSAGVADSTQGLDTPQALLTCADQELLASKRTGRNQVRRYVPSTLSG
jgi:two-component system, cell cycle response regulator